MNSDRYKKSSSFDFRFLVTIRLSSIYHKIQFMFLMMFWIFLFPYPAASQTSDTVRVGFSSRILNNINRNDALAAIRVWALNFVKEHNIPFDTKPLILDGIGEIKKALSNNELEYVSLTVDEYVKVRELLAGDTVTLGIVSGSVTEEFVLVVPKDSNIEKITDLKGCSLIILSSARMGLAKIWLETLFLREGLGTGIENLVNMISEKEVNKVILPLFFGKADAGLVTRKGFDTMSELNPQIKQKLKIINTSKPLVPTIFCFTANTDALVRKKVSEGITQWHTTPAGRQCLTIFKTERLVELHISILNTSLDLIAEHNRLINKVADPET